MKVNIVKDERWPEYIISNDNWNDFVIDLTEEELKFIKEATDQYNNAQSLLRDKCKEVDE